MIDKPSRLGYYNKVESNKAGVNKMENESQNSGGFNCPHCEKYIAPNSEIKKWARSFLNKLAGQSTSWEKTAAARRNGFLGGRPKKTQK